MGDSTKESEANGFSSERPSKRSQCFEPVYRLKLDCTVKQVQFDNDVGLPVIPSDADSEYFRGYGTIHIHEEMLADTVRTNAYRYALLKNYSHLYKGTVIDVGAGTGILSIFAVQAGAKKVYAVEASEMARHAQNIVKENKMEDRITVLETRAEQVEISEKVDAIVSEWMGYSLLYESMLPSVLRVRDKFLKPDGLMFPCRATLYLAPVHDEEYLERLEFWHSVKEMYKVSMESMIPVAHACLSGEADIREIPPEAVQAHGVKLCSFDLKTVTVDEVETVQCPFSFKCFGQTTITGFVTWFTVEFPGGTVLSTSPYEPATHWGQTALCLRQSFPVEQDTEITGTFEMHPHMFNHRCLEIDLKFTVDGTDSYHQLFSLSNTWPEDRTHGKEGQMEQDTEQVSK